MIRENASPPTADERNGLYHRTTVLVDHRACVREFDPLNKVLNDIRSHR